jgi:hypothetical protein
MMVPRRFHASVTLNPDLVGCDVGKIADEVLSHLSTLSGARRRVPIEVEAEYSPKVLPKTFSAPSPRTQGSSNLTRTASSASKPRCSREVGL